MAATETIQIPLGFSAPDFTLTDVVLGVPKNLNQLKGKKGTLIMFICNHCPYVIHVRNQLISLANEYIPLGISFIAISSNDVVNYPDDSPEKMKTLAIREKFPFPYLYDESQEVAKAYFAACTPDFSLFNEDLKCVYRGQLDDSRPKNDKPVNGKDLREAMNALLNGEEISKIQIPSIGCNIKWKNAI